MTKEKFIENKKALIVLIAASVVVLISMGIRQCWGLFYQYFETDLGFSRTQFGLAIAIQMLFWGAFAPVFGFFSCVGKFFSNKNRTIATGIVTATASFGYFLSPLFVQYSNPTYGWKNTLLFFIVFLIIGAITSFFLFKKEYVDETNNSFTRDQTASNALQEAFRHKGYLLLVAGFFVCGFQITLVATHLPGYIQQKGLPDWTAAAILSLIGLFNIVGTLGMGYLSTKYSKKILLSILYFSRGVILILFIFTPPSVYMALTFGVVFGMLWLATVPTTNGIVAQIFGTKYLTTLFGIVFFSHQAGSFLGAYLGGYFYDQFGNYDYAWYLSIFLSIFAGLVHLPIDENPVVRGKVTQA
ncbi:MAG: MFS transporter [Proteobacteria bacterium]|nr:MFS transporter [Pseudomonadota bacterium]